MDSGLIQPAIIPVACLRGKTADLPAVQLVKFELVINSKTARALGIVIQPTLRALAESDRIGPNVGLWQILLQKGENAG